MPKETLSFQTETQKILDLVIHSLYTHKEVFLRELVSNASDAIDKVRFQSLTRPEVLGSDTEFRITISLDREGKTLTVADNGCGMTREEVVRNIGTIARSGTREFVQQLQSAQKQDLQLIGQFGVGFYSAFMVADRVVLVTAPAEDGAPAVKWESKGDGTYTIEDFGRSGRGTSITLHLKDDQLEFLDEWRVKQIIKKYSDYVSYPIRLKYKAVDGKKTEDKEETVNRSTALWRRPKTEIKDEEYNEFYKYLSHDSADPLTVVHQSAEGTIEFKMLLFIPSRAPFDLYSRDYHGVRLYVKKMFIMDDCKELVPPFLRFVRGVVDSEDLSLNISRETLQNNAVVAKIRKQITAGVLGALEKLKGDQPEKYRDFFAEMGGVLKEGAAMAAENREKIVDLLLFRSTKSGGGFTSLAEYAERMGEKQKEIYYLTGLTREAVENSPHLEIFRAKDLEVLLLSEPVDEWVAGAVPEYKGKKLKSAAQGDLDLGDLGKEEKNKVETAEPEFKTLCDLFRSELQDEVKQVRLTSRLAESPCCLVSDEGDITPGMEQIMRALNKDFSGGGKKILELNPRHPVVAAMNEKAARDAGDQTLKQWAHLLYEQALLSQGLPLKNPAAFVRNLNAALERVKL